MRINWIRELLEEYKRHI